ncbi:MAG: hypothetical protein JSV04_09725 [Candidatus Heimdallarchaeota archaeon]|nr:MAG: hypothetical protein JSV04_09725 [Candidatus Heimdallarchaeota archaeon]
MPQPNIRIANPATPDKELKKKTKIESKEEELHPLELKYGKEPPMKIEPENRWRWH